MESENTTSANKRVAALIERSTKHGQAGRSGKSPTYLIWQSMVGRCHRPSDSSYRWYGAKGITVCERWHKFENFFEDMGEVPEGKHIHRKNDATIYSKETCQWMNESEHIGLHNQERGWGARLNRAQLIDRVAALQQQLAAEREQGQGALHHMEACRSLLNVPDDEVLYQAIKELQEQLVKLDTRRNNDLEQQAMAWLDKLAAERINTEAWRLTCKGKENAYAKMEQQLLAERDEKRELLDALHTANDRLARLSEAHRIKAEDTPA